jgi:hypothetical protein
MYRIVTDKSILIGDEKLVKREDWIPLSEMNTDIKILTHKMFDDAFDKIVKEHKPKHDVVFLSLCTSTRPYHLGRKWKTYMDEFSGKADLIVTSSGGIIPQAYWNSFPYLNYDGDSAKIANKLYAEKMEQRLLKFFKTHKYRYAIANFRPKLRNTPVVTKVFAELKEQGYVEDYIIVPSEQEYLGLQERGFPGGKMYPDLDEKIFEHLRYKVNNLSKFIHSSVHLF